MKRFEEIAVPVGMVLVGIGLFLGSVQFHRYHQRITRLERAQKETREVVIRLADIQSTNVSELRRAVEMWVGNAHVGTISNGVFLPTKQ
jgi:hypothetical protein